LEPAGFRRQACSGRTFYRSIFEAARWAPSSNNEQPWRISLPRKEDKDGFAKMLSVLGGVNVGWAKSAPVLALAVANLSFAKNNAPNRNDPIRQPGAATACSPGSNRTRVGLSTRWPDFDPEKRARSLEFPRDGNRLAALAIGYPGDPASLPQPLKGS